MFEMIVLGVVQGITEFLPISSSGHLVLLQRVFGMPETGLLLEILLHVGSLLAVLTLFFKDWLAMLLHPLSNRTLRLLIVATIPTVIAAIFFQDFLERAFGGWFLGVSFLITAALLTASENFVSRRAGRQKAGDDLASMQYRQAAAMGVMQAVAIVPGISRSGSTIAGGIVSGLSKPTAAHFSFLMSAVATVGSLVFKLKDLLGTGGAAFEGGAAALIVGMLASAVSGYLAIRWMLRLIRRVSLKWFAIYTAILGLLILCDQLFFGMVFERIV